MAPYQIERAYHYCFSNVLIIGDLFDGNILTATMRNTDLLASNHIFHFWFLLMLMMYVCVNIEIRQPLKKNIQIASNYNLLRLV